MSADNISHAKEGDIHPEEPLHLVKFLVISADGTVSYALKLRKNPTNLVFKKVSYLIGNNLTFVIPKYVSNGASQLYQISPPDKAHIKIVDMNDTLVPFNIIATSNPICAFYLNIAIDENLSCYGDLTLIFNQFDLTLTPIQSLPSGTCRLPIPDQWRWIASIVTIL
jgi:hypothetical protein